MKTKTLLFAFAAIAAAACSLTSCTNEEAITVDNARVPVSFAGSNIATVQSATRADAFAINDVIGIYMVKNATALAAANIAESAANRTYKAKAAGSTTVSFEPTANDQTIYYPAADAVQFIAYSPVSTTTTVSSTYDITVSVTEDQAANDLSTDWLYAQTAQAGGYTKTSTAVALSFEHKMTKVVFNITNGTGVDASSLTGLTVAIGGQQTQGTFKLTTGVIEPAAGTAKTITAKTAADGLSSEAIVLPCADNTSKILTFTNNLGEPFTAAIPHNEWEAGKCYTYNVTLKKTAVDITGSINTWDTTTSATDVDAN